jgi:hypothetical protein
MACLRGEAERVMHEPEALGLTSCSPVQLRNVG